MSISSSDQANNSPREIEYENDLIDLDYLQEKFDEDDVIPKEIDEEAHLKNPHSLHKEDLDQNPPKTVKEEIANLKAKVKRKQQANIPPEEQSLDHSSVPNHLTDAAKEERLPTLSKKISARSKIPSSSGHHPPSHPSDPPSGYREKSSHENKFPNLPTQRNKTHASQPKSLFKKRSNDAPGSVAAIASEEEDHLKSMEILKRREEEILRAKLKREKLLQEQAEYFPPSGYDPLAGMPGTSSSSKKTKKKKEAKEVSDLLFSLLTLPPVPPLSLLPAVSREVRLQIWSIWSGCRGRKVNSPSSSSTSSPFLPADNRDWRTIEFSVR
jgi:hypothetical protein